MKLIAPSILSADFSRLGEEVKALEKAGADWIHIDVMDGHFVPNITIGPLVVEAVRRVTSLPLDVHLMIAEPDRFLDDFIKAGSHYLTVHVEAAVHLDRTVRYIQEQGVKAGVSLNPATPLSSLDSVLEIADLILLMTVNPGFGGQKYITRMTPKIEELRSRLDQLKNVPILEVDGGIKLDNIAKVSSAGCDAFVSGSGVFGTEDYKKTIREMKKLAG